MDSYTIRLIEHEAVPAIAEVPAIGGHVSKVPALAAAVAEAGSRLGRIEALLSGIQAREAKTT